MQFFYLNAFPFFGKKQSNICLYYLNTFINAYDKQIQRVNYYANTKLK